MADRTSKKPHVQTKLKLALLALLLVFIGFFSIYFFPVLEPVYSTLISAILGILTIYSGGNLGVEFLSRKLPGNKPEESKDESGPQA